MRTGVEKSSARWACMAAWESSGKGTEEAKGEMGEGGRLISGRVIMDVGGE